MSIFHLIINKIKKLFPAFKTDNVHMNRNDADENFHCNSNLRFHFYF